MVHSSLLRVVVLLLLSQSGASFHKERLPETRASRMPKQNYRQLKTAVFAAAVDASKENQDESPSEVSQRRKKILATTFNLVKAVAGSGILALPGGVAAMSDYKTSLAPALVLMVSLGALSAYTFGLYGRLLNSHPAKSLGELWEKINGRSSSWVISLATLTFCFGGALSYSILLGDTFSALAQTAGLQGLLMARSVWILLVTSTILYPLCNLKSLLALAPLSISGVAAVAATTCFLGWRCPWINSNSPYAEGSGALISSLSARMIPKFNTYNKGALSLSSTILVGMAASAYLGHFSAPSFFDSLRQKDKSPKAGPSSKDLQSFNIMTGLGFGLATLLNCLVMAFGFLTFGGASTGVILNNFSTLDAGASICRLLMAVCVIGGYPFLVRAVTSEGLALLGKPMDDSVQARKRETVATSTTLLLLTLGSLVMKDAGFVIGFSGAVMGSFIVYIFPALLFLSHSRGLNLSLPQKLERSFCRGLTVFGAVVALLGGGVSVANTYFPHLLQ